MGTSCTADYGTRQPEDHPHACGDKNIREQNFETRAGSSPRVWGQARLTLRLCDVRRIIPTRVGTSVDKHVVILVQQDHPHACGDKYYTPYV